MKPPATLILARSPLRITLGGGGTDELRAQAIEDGMTPLWRDGMLKVKMGMTTPNEVIRNVFSIG